MAVFPGHGCEAGTDAEIAAMRAEWERREALRLKHQRGATAHPFETLPVWSAIYQGLLRAVRGEPDPY